MVRSGQSWELGEPDLNDRGQPIVHNIAQKLGCIRPNSDIDLPVHSVFPEDESSMAELARQLEEQQPHDHESINPAPAAVAIGDATYNRADRASSSELDHSDMEQDYRKMAFGSHNALSLSPQSFASASDFEFSTTPVDLDAGALFSNASSMPDFSSTWGTMPKAQQQQQQHQQQQQPQPQQSPTAMSMSFMQQPSSLQNLVMMGQNGLDADFGTIKPDILYANSDVMMGMADPMIYAGFDNESMRL